MPSYSGIIYVNTAVMWQGENTTLPIIKRVNGADAGQLTLASNEYPTGIAFSGDVWNLSEGKSSGTFYLSNANAGVKNALGWLEFEATIHWQVPNPNGYMDDRYDYATKAANQLNKSGQNWRNLQNAALTFHFEGGRGIYVGEPLYVTITTGYADWSITVNQATGGTASASHTRAKSGTEITLETKPDTGYQLSGWTKTPATLAITNNKFSMPDAAVTLTPQWSKADYAITKAVSPAGAGTITAPETGQYGDEVAVSQTPADGYTFLRWEVTGGGAVTEGQFTMPAEAVTLTAVYSRNSYAITKATNPAGAGSITAPGNAGYGDEISISQAANTGYTFHHWELSTGTQVTANKFTMPNEPVTITAVYQRNAYQITAKVSPAGAGVVTVNGSAGYGEQVAISQQANEGYYFDGWTLSNGGKVNNGTFTMPDSGITITAKYLRRSVGSLNKTRLQGGTSATLTITSESTEYTHKYRINFGTGMDTGWTDVPAGSYYSVSIDIPKIWANQIPTAQTKSGGTIALRTYKGTTLIGTWESGGLTYEVPADAMPNIGSITTSILRTVDEITYANIGEFYVQGHCGVTITAGAGSGNYNAVISVTKIWIAGYTGARYGKTDDANGTTLNSGLLDRSGDTEIYVQVTDSRGLSSVAKRTIRVEEYEGPNITEFECWRVNDNGEADEEQGEKGQYTYRYNWTMIGSNTVTRKLTVGNVSVMNPETSGWLLPGGRLIIDKLRSYEITLEIYDVFERTKLTYRIDGAKYMMHFGADGESVAFGHAVSQTRSDATRYSGTFEVDESLEFYYGNRTLAQYILYVVNNNMGTGETGGTGDPNNEAPVDPSDDPGTDPSGGTTETPPVEPGNNDSGDPPTDPSEETEVNP